MMRDVTMPRYRRLAPIVLFAIVILSLVLSAVMSIADMVALRDTLATETELLTKLKQRARQTNGDAKRDPHDYVFEAPSQGVATGELQRRVSDILNASGADLQLSEIIPAPSEGDVGRLAIAVNFEIDEARMIDLLYAIENAKPALLVERVSLRTLASGEGARHRNVQGTATVSAAWKARP